MLSYDQFVDRCLQEVLVVGTSDKEKLKKAIEAVFLEYGVNEVENPSLVLFARRIAEQTPEKPDYWSSCGQCDRNISVAEEILEKLGL